MKSIIFCGLFLALIMSCRAEDPNGPKVWKEMREKMCDVGISADTVNKLLNCHKEHFGETKHEWVEKLLKECETEGADDAKAFTNLTTDEQKNWAMFTCGKKFKECLKKKGGHGGKEHKGKKDMSEEDKKEHQDKKDKFKAVMECKVKALDIKSS